MTSVLRIKSSFADMFCSQVSAQGALHYIINTKSNLLTCCTTVSLPKVILILFQRSAEEVRFPFQHKQRHFFLHNSGLSLNGVPFPKTFSGAH